jgi:cell division protein FtsB
MTAVAQIEPKALMKLEAELAQLRFENKWLREANNSFEAENKQLREDKIMLERQVLRLQGYVERGR